MLLGDISDSSLVNFLQEYFNEDHAGEGRQCVILRNCIPSHTMQMTLNAPEYMKDVIYLEGNASHPKDLNRACITQACAVIVLNDKLSLDASYSDTNIILQAMIIRNFFQQEEVDVRICMQLLKPESITHYKLSLDAELIKDDQIVCVE